MPTSRLSVPSLSYWFLEKIAGKIQPADCAPPPLPPRNPLGLPRRENIIARVQIWVGEPALQRSSPNVKHRKQPTPGENDSEPDPRIMRELLAKK